MQAGPANGLAADDIRLQLGGAQRAPDVGRHVERADVRPRPRLVFGVANQLGLVLEGLGFDDVLGLRATDGDVSPVVGFEEVLRRDGVVPDAPRDSLGQERAVLVPPAQQHVRAGHSGVREDLARQSALRDLRGQMLIEVWQQVSPLVWAGVLEDNTGHRAVDVAMIHHLAVAPVADLQVRSEPCPGDRRVQEPPIPDPVAGRPKAAARDKGEGSAQAQSALPKPHENSSDLPHRPQGSTPRLGLQGFWNAPNGANSPEQALVGVHLALRGELVKSTEGLVQMQVASDVERAPYVLRLFQKVLSRDLCLLQA